MYELRTCEDEDEVYGGCGRVVEANLCLKGGSEWGGHRQMGWAFTNITDNNQGIYTQSRAAMSRQIEALEYYSSYVIVKRAYPTLHFF